MHEFNLNKNDFKVISLHLVFWYILNVWNKVEERKFPILLNYKTLLVLLHLLNNICFFLQKSIEILNSIETWKDFEISVKQAINKCFKSFNFSQNWTDIVYFLYMFLIILLQA